MASSRWSPENSSESPTHSLVDPSDAPSEKEGLLWLIVELCKRSGKDKQLNQLISQQLRTVKDKEMKKIFKNVSSIQFKYRGQESVAMAPKAKVNPFFLYHPSVQLYDFVETHGVRVSAKMPAYFHFHGVPASTSDLFISPRIDLVGVGPTFPFYFTLSVSFRQPGSRLCVLLLAEIRAQVVNTACRFIPLFIDLTAAQQSILPTVPTRASSSNVLSATSSSSSTTEDLPSRKICILQQVPDIAEHTVMRVPTLPIMAIMFFRRNSNPVQSLVGIDSHKRMYYGTGGIYVKTFDAALNPTQSASWPHELFEEFEFCLANQHPCLTPMVGVSAENSVPALYFSSGGYTVQNLLQNDRSPQMVRVLFEEIYDILSVAADGLAFLHSCNRVHGRFWAGCIERDTDGTIRIFDYSCKTRKPLAIPADDSPAQAGIIYQAPESDCLEEMNTACDVYSFGVLLWNMFHRITPSHYTNRDVRAGVNFSVDDSLSFLSIGLEPLFRSCTARDPAQRPSISEVASELFQLSSTYRLKAGWTGPPEIFYEEGQHSFSRSWLLGHRAIRY